MRDPYVTYQYETSRFILRQVTPEDAPALLACYSDPAAVARMNADNCGLGFLCQNEEEMRTYIGFWLREYSQRMYIRPVIVDKRTGHAVGTMEFYNPEEGGLLRLDLRSDYERPEVLDELYKLAAREFPRDFPMAALLTKAPPAAPLRRQVLGELGFAGPEDFRGYPDYYRARVGTMNRELGLAYCGLACCLCSESADCPGCQAEGCPGHKDCKNYQCCQERGAPGCWACPDFPCGQGMHSSLRIQAFARFAKEHGAERLLDCLERNAWAGVVYHQPGGLTGDYDLPTEEEIFRLLMDGPHK